MMDSAGGSIWLCHEVETRGAFAVLCFHSRAADPSVSFGLLGALCSISVVGRVVRRGHLYAISVRDLPATVSQRHCGVSRIVKRNSRTQVSFDCADPRPCDVSHFPMPQT